MLNSRRVFAILMSHACSQWINAFQVTFSDAQPDVAEVADALLGGQDFSPTRIENKLG